jgi:tRNA modification GTPase
MLTDPIVALATPPGRSALAVIRLSGRGALAVAARVIPTFRAEPARQARLATFQDSQGQVIDRGLYTVFPAPRSATGEDVVEFSCHGGHVVPARLVAALEAAGARPAGPGEFTRRAVLHGKLDLLQAEAVADLVQAEAPVQARTALAQLEGGLSRRIEALRAGMVELLAMLAYDVDFPGEDDGPVSPVVLDRRRADVLTQVERLLATAPLADRVRQGALVVLVGAPNVGKSSLFNAFLGSERALVTELPGTTRDAIEAPADFFGWPIRLVDTAGLGETSDRIDAMGQAVSRRYLEAADLVLECDDGRLDGPAARRFAPSATGSGRSREALMVHTKADLEGEAPGVAVSALTGQGLDELRRAVVERLFQGGASLADLEPMLTRERHRVALTRAREGLADAAPHLVPGGDPVLAAHHVQEAMRALDVLVGAVDIEEVLDRVFASFCVGK